jgi:hypothetical protein
MKTFLRTLAEGHAHSLRDAANIIADAVAAAKELRLEEAQKELDRVAVEATLRRAQLHAALDATRVIFEDNVKSLERDILGERKHDRDS